MRVQHVLHQYSRADDTPKYIYTLKFLHYPEQQFWGRLDGDTAVGAHLAGETGGLARGELGHAAVNSRISSFIQGIYLLARRTCRRCSP